MCMLFCGEYLGDALLAMEEAHFDAKLAVYVFGKMLCGIYGAVLSACASEGEH